MQNTLEFDLIVAGGGTAGTLSAIAAAREGLKVAVLERGTCLGGMATSSGLTEMNAAGFQGAPLYRGIEREIFDRMIWSGHAAYHFAVPMSSNKNVKIDRLRYDPEQLKLLLEQLAVQAGVALFYETEVTAAREEDGSCRVTARSRFQTLELHSRYLIDATGNAGLVQALGGDGQLILVPHIILVAEGIVVRIQFRCLLHQVEKALLHIFMYPGIPAQLSLRLILFQHGLGSVGRAVIPDQDGDIHIFLAQEAVDLLRQIPLPIIRRQKDKNFFHVLFSCQGCSSCPTIFSKSATNLAL